MEQPEGMAKMFKFVQVQVNINADYRMFIGVLLYFNWETNNIYVISITSYLLFTAYRGRNTNYVKSQQANTRTGTFTH